MEKRLAQDGLARDRAVCFADHANKSLQSLAIMAMQATPQQATPRLRPVASLTNMAIMLLIQVAFVASGFRMQRQPGTSLLPQHTNLAPLYLELIAVEWVLVLVVYRGIKRNRGSLWELIGGRWSSWRDIARDVAICVPFLFVWEGTAWLMHRLLGPDKAKSVQTLLPQSAMEIVLWILLSVTAGICEEIVYRGYFQRQFAAYTNSMVAGVLLQAVVFGLGHSYQGMKQVIIITVLGILYGWFAAWRRSLRPTMIAHAWTDIYNGYLRAFLR